MGPRPAPRESPVLASNNVFRALADPTRRQILQLLRDGPMASGDIAARFPTAWSTISRHLSVLREGGLVLVEREGTILRYELNTTVMQELVKGLLDLTERREGIGSDRSDATDGPEHGSPMAHATDPPLTRPIDPAPATPVPTPTPGDRDAAG